MIITDTLNQPLALAIYAILGIILGILYALNYFVCTFVIKSKIYRHITQIIYVLIYASAFFGVTYKYFDYSLKIYQILICLTFTMLTSVLLYMPMKKYKTIINAKSELIVKKLADNKLARKFKK